MNTFNSIFVKRVISITIIIISCTNSLNAQWLLKGYPPLDTTSFYSQAGRLGIGVTTPSAKLHVRSLSISQDPIFKVQYLITTNFGASVQFFRTQNNKLYGLYETSSI